MMASLRILSATLAAGLFLPGLALAQSTKVCTAGDCSNGRGTAEYRKDGELVVTYTGDFQAGLPTGQGSYVEADGAKFTGQVDAGSPIKGTMTYPDDDSYTGAFKDGMYNGQGTYIFGAGEYEGDTLVGTYADDKPVKGTYTWASGQTYTGDWDGWVRSGKGRIVYTSGNSYNGDWLNGERHGEGTYTWTNGMTFTGT